MGIKMEVTAPGSGASREARRQRAVESLGVLDGGPHERLDRITRLPRTIFGVPAGVASLAGQRMALDDVTAVAVFRRRTGTSLG
jgi:hypothetical protein